MIYWGRVLDTLCHKSFSLDDRVSVLKNPSTLFVYRSCFSAAENSPTKYCVRFDALTLTFPSAIKAIYVNCPPGQEARFVDCNWLRACNKNQTEKRVIFRSHRAQYNLNRSSFFFFANCGAYRLPVGRPFPHRVQYFPTSQDLDCSIPIRACCSQKVWKNRDSVHIDERISKSGTISGITEGRY